MKLMEVILQDENLEEAIKRVKSNKGVAGVDKMTVDEVDNDNLKITNYDHLKFTKNGKF